MKGRLLPVPPTLRRYRRAWITADLLAGLTLVAIAVPEQMATARLVGMPAVTGLYAFVVATVTFALLGHNPQLSVGADSTIAPVLAAGVTGVVAAGSTQYAPLAGVLALMVGGVVIAVGALRMGWIAELLSLPVILGVLGGIAVQIVVRQLPAIFGVPGGGTTTIGRLGTLREQLGGVCWWCVAIAVLVLVVIEVTERLDRRVPGALIGLVGASGLVAVLGLQQHGVPVIGTVRGGLPAVRLPHAPWRQIRPLVAPAVTVAFICLAQTAAASSQSGRATQLDDFDQDLVAIGAGSVAAGLFGSFAVNSSPPRTEVVAMSGGRSQLAGLTAAAVALAVVVLATGLLHDIPEAALGAVLVFVATRIFRVSELHSVLRYDRVEFGVAVATLLAVAVLGIEDGAVVAIMLSLADRTRRSARPADALMGRESGTDHWISDDVGRPTEQVPGVLVYLLYAPLWYGNANYVRRRVKHLIRDAEHPVHALVLDADGMADIDFTGARALGLLAGELKAQGVVTAVARSSHLVHHDLKHSGLLSDIGPEHLFASVEDAVAALSRGA